MAPVSLLSQFPLQGAPGRVNLKPHGTRRRRNADFDVGHNGVQLSLDRPNSNSSTTGADARPSISSPHSSSTGSRKAPNPGVPFPRRSLLLGASTLALPVFPSVSLVEHAQAGVAIQVPEKAQEKTRNLPLEALKDIIAADISDRQYFVTGKMTKSIYRDDCFFIDPMNQITGVDNYILGISLFLDPACAYNELLGISTTEPNVVEAIWGLSGYFRYVPWQPYLSPIVGGTKYVFDDEGLVMRHEETWSISNAEAWRITLTPAFADKDRICREYQGKTLPM